MGVGPEIIFALEYDAVLNTFRPVDLSNKPPQVHYAKCGYACHTAQQESPTRKRIEILNTKAYYLLVALSFLFTKGPVGASLKVALTLTAAVAVLPVLDYAPEQALGCIRFFKVACLVAALGFTLYWLWTANMAIVPANAR